MVAQPGGGTIRISFDVAPVAAQLDLVQGTMNKLEPLMRAMEHALWPTAQLAARYAPQPGSEGFTTPRGARRTRRRLFRQMVVASRLYPRKKVIVGVAGPRYAKRGGANHGHLVELGHRINAHRAHGPIKTELLRMQKAGWTDEKVWNSRLRTLVSKHGAGRRNSPGASIVKSAGFVAPKPFLKPATDSTKQYAQADFELAVGKFIGEAIKQVKGNG